MRQKLRTDRMELLCSNRRAGGMEALEYASMSNSGEITRVDLTIVWPVFQ